MKNKKLNLAISSLSLSMVIFTFSVVSNTDNLGSKINNIAKDNNGKVSEKIINENLKTYTDDGYIISGKNTPFTYYVKNQNLGTRVSDNEVKLIDNNIDIRLVEGTLDDYSQIWEITFNGAPPDGGNFKEDPKISIFLSNDLDFDKDYINELRVLNKYYDNDRNYPNALGMGSRKKGEQKYDKWKFSMTPSIYESMNFQLNALAPNYYNQLRWDKSPTLTNLTNSSKQKEDLSKRWNKLEEFSYVNQERTLREDPRIKDTLGPFFTIFYDSRPINSYDQNSQVARSDHFRIKFKTIKNIESLVSHHATNTSFQGDSQHISTDGKIIKPSVLKPGYTFVGANFSYYKSQSYVKSKAYTVERKDTILYNIGVKDKIISDNGSDNQETISPMLSYKLVNNDNNKVYAQWNSDRQFNPQSIKEFTTKYKAYVDNDLVKYYDRLKLEVNFVNSTDSQKWEIIQPQSYEYNINWDTRALSFEVNLKMLKEDESQKWKDKIDQLPYISNTLKNSFKTEIDNIYKKSSNTLENEAQEVFDRAKQQSGLGVLSDNNEANNGYAKNLIQEYNKLMLVKDKIKYGYADESRKRSFDEAFNQVLNGNGTGVNFGIIETDNSQFNASSGYSQYKLQRKLENNEYHVLHKKMQDAYSYLNGLDVQNAFDYYDKDRSPQSINENNRYDLESFLINTSHSKLNPETTTLTEASQETGKVDAQLWRSNDGVSYQTIPESVYNGYVLHFEGIEHDDTLNKNGQIRLKYKIKSPKDVQENTNLDQLETREAIIGGFQTISSEQERLNEININQDYKNKETIIPYNNINYPVTNGLDTIPEQYRLKRRDLLFTANNSPNSEWRFEDNSDITKQSWINDSKQIKITNIRFGTSSDTENQTLDRNPKNGSIRFKYDLYSTRNGFEELKLNNNDTYRTINGFKTEAKRLGELARDRLRTKEPLVNAVNSIKMKDIFPNFETEQPSAKDLVLSQYMTGSDVAYRETFNKILAIALPNEHAEFGDYWLDYTNVDNRKNGEYQISNDYGNYIGRYFRLKSTLPGLDDVLGLKEDAYKAMIDIYLTLWRTGPEKNRVSRYASDNLGEYSGNKNIVPYDANSTNIDHLNFIGNKKTIKRWKNVNNERVYEDKQVWSQDENQIFITDPSFIRFDPRRGEAEYQYIVRSSRTNTGWTDELTGVTYSDQWYYDTFFYTRKTTIRGFKTEQNRVDEIIDQMPDINRLLEIYGRTDIKNNTPIKSKENIKSVIEEWLRDPNKELRDSNSWINVANQKNDVALVEDSLNWNGINDQDGTITRLTFKVQSTKNNLIDIHSKEKDPQTLTDFYSINKEIDRLNNINIQLDYDNKQNVIPYTITQKTTLRNILNNPNLDINQVLLISQGWNKVNNEWVNETQKAKLVLEPIDDDITSRNALKGNIKVKYKLLSNDSERFDNPSYIQTPQKEKTISGFKTEKQRVLEVVSSVKEKLNTNNFYSQADKNNTTAFEVTRKQGEQTQGIDNSMLLVNKLKAEFDKYHVNFKQDSDHSLQFSQDSNNFNSGIIAGIKFELKSTIDDLTSANSSFIEFGDASLIDGFWTEEKEIELLKQVNPQFDYLNKENTIPYSVSEISPTLKDHLNLNGHTSNNQESLVFVPQNQSNRWNINNISVIEVDPKGNGGDNTGKIKLGYTIQSTKNWRLNGDSNSNSNLSSAKVTLPSNENSNTYINGFKTEKQRLNEVLNEMPSLQNLFNDHIDRSKKIFDENNNVTNEFKEEIIQLVNQWLRDHGDDHTNSYAEIDNLVVGPFDQETGDISSITFNLQSTKDNLSDVHSDNKAEQHINGFKTIKEEEERLTRVAQKLHIDYQAELKKQKVRYGTDDFKISELQLPEGWIQGPGDNEWFNNRENVVLTNIRFSEPNAADGTVKIDYDIKTYEGDFGGTTKENPVRNTMISNFATEADRLDWILSNDTRSNGIHVPIIDYNPDNSNTLLNAEDKKHTVDWINSKEDQNNPDAPTRLLDKLQKWFNNQPGADIKVVDLQAEYDNENGTIKNIQYKLESTKQNLVPTKTQPKITSIKYSDPQNAINFLTPQQVKNELQNAVDSVKRALDYGNKSVPPYSDNSTLKEQKLYNSLLEDGWEKQVNEAGSVSFVKEHTRLEFVNQNNSDKPFSDSDPIGKPAENPADNSASTKAHFKITSEWPDFKDQPDFVKNENKTIPGFKTEKQRLNDFVKELVDGNIIDNLLQNKSETLVKDVTKEIIGNALNHELTKLDPKGVSARIDNDKITLTKNAKNGTIDVEFKITSTVNGINQDSDTNNELKVKNPLMTNNNQISGFKTNYTNVMEQFKKQGLHGVATVDFINKSNQRSITANQEDAQNPNSYSFEIKKTLKDQYPDLSKDWVVITPETIAEDQYQSYQQYLPKVIAHDEINGRTIIAYYLIDKDPDHANALGTLPVSQKFYAVVSDFQTEQTRLEVLKNFVNENLDNVKSPEQRRPYLPTDTNHVSNSDIGFERHESLLSNEPNYLDAQMTHYERDNTHGTIKVTHIYKTNKDNKMLYSIDDPELNSMNNKAEVLNQIGFDNLNDEQINNKKATVLTISQTQEKVFNNYRTYLEVLTEQVNEIKKQLNQENDTLEKAIENNNYWSQAEKNKYINDLEKIIDDFKKNTANESNSISQNDEFFNQARQAIYNTQNDLNQVNNDKKESFESIDQLHHLNPKQKQERQKEILQSNKKVISNSQASSTDSVVQKANELEQSMDKLSIIVDADSILKRNKNYNKIPNKVRELYEKLINDAKDLEANKSSINGITSENWSKALKALGIQNQNIEIPTRSDDDTQADWNKEQVDALSQLIKFIKNEILDNLNKLEETKRQIDNMNYLSDQEKEALKDRVDNPDKDSNNSINDYDNVLKKAKEINKQKENLYNQVDATPKQEHTYEYLNNDQKGQIKNDIIKSILEDQSEDSITAEAQKKIQENQKVENYLDVQKRATKLNNSMKDLKEREDSADSIRQDQNKYINATEESKDIYNKLIQSAQKLRENQYNKNTTEMPTWGNDLSKPNDNTWNKAEVDHLNDLIDRALKKMEAEAGFKNNPYLSEEEKAKLYENVQNATSIEEIQKQVDIAEKIKNTKKDLIDNLNINFPHLNKDQREAISKEIIDAVTPDTTIYQEIKYQKPQLEVPNQVLERAGSLDDTMKQNQELIQNQDSIHTSEKYQKAPKEYKELYDHAINASKDLQNNKSDITSTNNDIDQAWSKDVTKPETSNKNANDHKANWNKVQVDELNRIIEDILEKMDKFKENIEEIQRQIDRLEYLSKEEKAKFKDQLEHTNNPDDANKIWDQAQKDNQAKKDIVDQIFAHKHLNDDQKQYFKEKIINTQLHDNELQENQPSIDSIKNEAQQLDDKMGELDQISQIASKLIEQPAFEQNASKEQQEKFIKAIQDAYDTLANKVINNNEDANLNKDEVQELIDKIKLEHDATIDHIIDNLDGLIEEEKASIKENIHHQPSEDATLEELAKQKDISDTVNELIIKEANYFNTADNNLINQINNLIKHLQDLGVKTRDFIEVKDSLIHYHDLLDALRQYRDSNVKDQHYQELKEKLEQEISLVTTLVNSKYPKLNKIINGLNISWKIYQVQGEDEIALVYSLLELQKDQFNKFIKDLNNRGEFSEYNDLANTLNKVKYFGKMLAGRADNYQLLQSIWTELSKLKFDQISKVLESALIKNFEEMRIAEEKLGFLWWFFLATNSALILGIIIFLTKYKNKNQ